MAFVPHGAPCDKEALSTAAWADGDAIVPDDSNDDSGAITGCTFSGTVSVSGQTSTAGGVCGINQGDGTIENCRNDGSVHAENGTSPKAGGVCGYNAGKVTNCLNTGKVTASGSSISYAGGVCGENNSGIGTVTGTVTNCYYLTGEAGEGYPTTGIGGSGDKTGATSKTRTELASGEVAYLLNNKVTTGGETAPWRQNLDNGTTKDPFPVPDDDHGMVYRVVEEDGTVWYSNYPNGEPDTGGETGGGSSSGGDSYDDSEPTYSPSLDVSDGGSIKVSPRTPEAGETVTITPTPEAGYDVDTVTVTDRSGREVEVTEHRNSTWTFTQPRGRVTIEVTFRKTGPEAPALRRRARGLLGRDGHPVCLRRGPDGRHQRLRLQPRRHHLPAAGVDDPGPAGRL